MKKNTQICNCRGNLNANNPDLPCYSCGGVNPVKKRVGKLSGWNDGEWLKGMGLSGSQAEYILQTVDTLLERYLNRITKWAKEKKHIYPATELKDAGYEINTANDNQDAEGSRMLGNIEGYNEALLDLREFVIPLGREK
jgi:hypothetical protein